MSALRESLRIFSQKLADVLTHHGLSYDQAQPIFSRVAIQHGELGDFDSCAQEMRNFIAATLGHLLSETHSFLEQPWVRKMMLPDGTLIKVAIINSQSAEWYGTEQTISSFDFLLKPLQAVFKESKTFLDLGGHQFVWSAYYALHNRDATVVTFEPSILNVTIGLFNCLVNGVIDRVNPIPFAVSVAAADETDTESKKMLVDFMTVPLNTTTLNSLNEKTFDFVKVDIEGYEYELLSDPTFVEMVKGSKGTHFELHLGHLVQRGVTLENCISALRKANFSGVELYSLKEMYEFLEGCDSKGFYAFLVT